MSNGQRPIDYGALEQRVYSVEQGITNLSNQIGGLSTKIDERSRTSWPTLASFAGFLVITMGGLGGLAYAPIQSSLARIEGAMPNYVTIREHSIVLETVRGNIGRLEKQIEKNQDGIVPRGEHEQKWAQFTLSVTNLQRQVDDIRKDFGQTYSLRDAFVNVQRKVEDLEKELRASRAP